MASLSLSPLVTDPAASRPPGERECGGLSLSHRWSLIRPHPVRRGKGVRWPLSLSPLVTDPVASRPPGEREEVHRFSVQRRRGSTSRSAIHAILSDEAPARQGQHYLLADSARRRSPSYFPTTSRYPSGLAPLPVFPRRCMWIFDSSFPKT